MLPDGLLPQAALAFALTSLLIELTPGPNMTWLAIVAASQGRRPGFAAVAGVALGLATVGIAAALGFSAFLSGSPVAYLALRWAGVAYLLWLAYDGWQTSARVADGHRMLSGAVQFRRGLITNLLNPKAAVFYVAVLPGFLGKGAGIAAELVLTAIYVAVATAIHGAIVLLASHAEPFLNDPRREKIARRTLSLLLALVAVWFGWSTAR